MAVVEVEIAADGGFQFAGAAVDATAQLLLGERGKPALDQLLRWVASAGVLSKVVRTTRSTSGVTHFARRPRPRFIQQAVQPPLQKALPERMRAAIRGAMSQAYAGGIPGAAASLREGLDETLTIMRLELPESLARVLSSTNLIENLFSRVRETARRVRRWQGGEMVLRWTAAGVLEAERNFRKVVGYRSLGKLDAALRAHDAAVNRRVDNSKQAA
jgi:hypothetical protein